MTKKVAIKSAQIEISEIFAGTACLEELFLKLVVTQALMPQPEKITN